MQQGYQDPRETLALSPMSAAQVRVIAVTVGLCALDGFDVLAISFASPGIAHEWGINRAALGVVLSMELLGMAIGAILVGGLADRIGRRRTLLGCLLVMTFGMAMAITARSVVSLSAWRVITGLGIGGMLAALTAIASEFASGRRRDLCVALMSIGYPLGAVLGGSIAAKLLVRGDWRSGGLGMRRSRACRRRRAPAVRVAAVRVAAVRVAAVRVAAGSFMRRCWSPRCWARSPTPCT